MAPLLNSSLCEAQEPHLAGSVPRTPRRPGHGHPLAHVVLCQEGASTPLRVSEKRHLPVPGPKCALSRSLSLGVLYSSISSPHLKTISLLDLPWIYVLGIPWVIWSGAQEMQEEGASCSPSVPSLPRSACRDSGGDEWPPDGVKRLRAAWQGPYVPQSLKRF